MEAFRALAHIAILTTSLEDSIAFYERLGGQVTARGEAPKPAGVNRLAMVSLAGFALELIEPHDGTPVEAAGGVQPHFAIAVDDLEAAVAAVRAAGIDAFRTDAPNVLPHLFGGLKNQFFTGPSGELIELLQLGL